MAVKGVNITDFYITMGLWLGEKMNHAEVAELIFQTNLGTAKCSQVYSGGYLRSVNCWNILSTEFIDRLFILVNLLVG